MAENSRSEVDASRTLVRGDIERVFQPGDRGKPLTDRRSAAAQSFHALNICSDKVKRKSGKFFDPFRSRHVVRINKFTVSELERKVRLNERSFAAFHTILHLDDNRRLTGVLTPISALNHQPEGSRQEPQKRWSKGTTSAGRWAAALAWNSRRRRAPVAETRKPAIVRQPRRKYWRGHVAMYRNSDLFSVGLPSSERRSVVLPTARFWSRERREARAEILAHRHLPGTKVPRPSGHYHWNTVSVPLVLAEVEGRLWRSRQPVRRYPARPVREGACG